MDAEVIVIGAGIAGLTAARELVRAGRRVLVLEKSRGVGGRCATRRIDGQAVDHGLAFLHGSDPGFLEAIDAAGGGRIEWPLRIRGNGTPCQPRAFGPRERRTAFEAGLTVFPKSLAAGLRIRLSTRAAAGECVEGGVRVRIEDGAWLSAGELVLALPVEQSAVFLAALAPASPETGAARHLLESVGSFPCLTVLAGYRTGEAVPDWDVWYPEDSGVLQLLSHDSAKRGDPRANVLVYQALPRWSRSRLEEAPESWSRGILDEAGRLLGTWAGRPDWVETHRWRYARTDDAGAFGRPLLVPLPGGGRVGVAGDVFSPRSGGAEAAWQSGRELARRMLTEERG